MVPKKFKLASNDYFKTTDYISGCCKVGMLAATFKVFLMIGIVVAFRDYQKQIPNGDIVPDPCHPNKLWQGVGHKQLSGGGDRNLFGKDFKAAGKVGIYFCPEFGCNY